MEKFGMNFGSGPSKKELLETIEGQKKQLVQYQVRLKDVVRAYKSLLKEKEALEASLKVLSVSQEADLSLKSVDAGAGANVADSSDPGDDRCSVHSEDSVGTATSVETAASLTSSTKGELTEDDRAAPDPLAAVSSLQKSEETSSSESGISTSSGDQLPSVEADRRVLQLKTKVSTLTNALSTVTQEKSRMEASYQADKKKMKQELDDLASKIEEERGRHEMEVKGLQEQLAETKARLITQQHERAQEQSDHAVMLRELQKLLQDERASRQDVELRLEETREALAEKMYAAERAGDCELQAKQLSKEAEELRKRLQSAEEDRDRPDPRLQEMQEEITGVKAHFQSQLQQEMRKVAQTEEQLRQQSQMEEERVANLEAQVSELSELLGTYEKAKQKDQVTIQKLKDRIVQLDTENKTLAIAASSRTSADIGIDEANWDVNLLKEKLEKVKKLLLLAGKKSQQSLDIESLCEVNSSVNSEATDGEKATVLYYQQELKQLKEEFERYKMRAQVVLKNKTTKDSNVVKELEELRELHSDLKEKYIALRLSSDEMENQHRQELEAKQLDASRLQQAHKQELERMELEYRDRALKLEEEMHKQRDRALAILAEKDHELEHLRTLSFSSSLPGYRSYIDNKLLVDGEEDQDDAQAGFTNDSLSQALKLAGPNEPTLLLYAEQLARKEVEIGALRKQKHKLEMEVHQLQDKLIMEGERHQEEVGALMDQVKKNIRDQSREGANLEYLKNIIYRFLTLQDSLGRQQTLTAILTILHFSPQEKQVVLKHQTSSWWTSGKR
ncbi:GRIP and coiled-coil domain-containing protein 1 [Latimeria chalumnae]|uniref:GRIP and coiled-coil domain-containing protein 1 n=1 Tax=Latimeria chalumnae TaxID=7897 RepID=H3AVI4_LATCH|nr:PREDICTED: GRIP and coiled-coil domain-containing protein 1 [Latimeria chalumnae]XP_014348812.1 PREDICTED: GRIP and coiled-coil domain-containing protein 1 [Latimeria chalumnae]|eukprot:XP_006004145.1 PREDICTED: GRIP and coiled-coil domain-containing protein 1 [Latimeria chalumnae]